MAEFKNNWKLKLLIIVGTRPEIIRLAAVPDYLDENVSTKVVKIIQSYVGIVNKMVWRKE